MDTREFKGLELAAKANIEWRKTYFYVPSSTYQGGYKVDAEATACTCDDFELRQQPCKHIHAVKFVKERNRGKPIPEMPDPETVAVPMIRPTYRQAWPAYNAAQVNEKAMFQKLLADLCKGVEWSPRGGPGRPRIPYDDAIFSAVFKVYSTFSGRRFSTDLREAKEAGHIEEAPHYNSVFRVLEDANTTPVLKQLVIQSSLPLKQVETEFACDSSGFSTSRFARWFDTKYGVNRKKADWVKCHISTGVKTNIVTAVEISDQHDSPVFKQLMATTAVNFEVKEVSADKAYSSFENLELIDEMKATPYIAFKVNSRPAAGIWGKMLGMFMLNRDEYLKHYHKRSNVESTFSAVKRKFGDFLRSKTDVALKNELLAKIVCHNIVVVIHEMYELNIDPTFGEHGEREVLKFPNLG
jgi:transposase